MNLRSSRSQTAALLRRVRKGHSAKMVRERLLHVSTLNRGLQFAVYGSYFVLICVAVLVALHSKLEHGHILSAAGIAMPAAVVAASPVFAVSIALILTGAMLSNRRMRVAEVVLLALALSPSGWFARHGFVCCDAPEVVHTRPPTLVLTLLFESAAGLSRREGARTKAG